MARSTEKLGSTKEPLQEEVEGILGQVIKPGDKVFTFTQVYGRGTRIWGGIYRGTVKTKNVFGNTWTYYIVEREGGKRTKLNYNGIVLSHTTLADLNDRVI